MSSEPIKLLEETPYVLRHIDSFDKGVEGPILKESKVRTRRKVFKVGPSRREGGRWANADSYKCGSHAN